MKRITLPGSRKQKIIIGSLFVLGLLLIVGFYNKNAVRTELIPNLVSATHKHGIESQFKNDFEPVNAHFATFGITTQDPNYDFFSCGNNAMYVDYSGVEGLAMTVGCIRDFGTQDFAVTEEFLDKWNHGSSDLEAYLMANGWHEYENSGGVSLGKLFSTASDDYISYKRSHGPTTCSLEIWRSVPLDNFGQAVHADETVGVRESCEREISLFGGYHKE